MLDQRARAYTRIRRQQPRTLMSQQEAAKLDSLVARSYTDDADVRRNALSAPRIHFRPGQRDDEVRCNFVGMLPMI